MKIWKKVSFILAICTLGLVSYFSLNLDSHTEHNFAFAQSSSITIITLTNENILLSEGEYSITPDPFKMTGTLTIKDNSSLDSEKEKNGIITITGVKNGNYTVNQIGIPSGYSLDKFSKIIEVKDSSAVASFTNNLGSIDSSEDNSVRNITYTAKFVCGSVFGDEGPLRPGHYDTDISIFNKQNFPIKILWNVVINDGAISNSILKNLDEETSTAIVCKQMRELLGLGNNSEKLVEGFAIIRIQLDSMLETEDSKVVRNISKDEINLLDVQVFYTANALPTLPHEVIIDKISFYIIQDGSGLIPQEMMRKPLDISLPSQLNEISNTEIRIKNVLAEKYNLSSEDLTKVVLRIKDVSVGVGALVDDHAISLHVVNPQAGS
ncbi:MAG TPA: SpaA isopeptide-forming pilin-related protein [Nitrosopumilaceae archaeon]|nr:SpaA isopeptide-forming pilin-related protein [Nitrosopumilaceae archaeon]